jgi:hypothetical protein
MNKLLKILLIISFVFFYSKTFAQTSVAEAQAIFMYNFTRLIEWPADCKSGDFVIGVYGSPDVYVQLNNYMTGKKVGSQPIKVFKFTYITDITKCHILFVSLNKTKDMSTLMGIVGNNKTLLITEKRGALSEGAAINFVVIDDKLKFELKVSNAAKSGLKVHSNLEAMAVSTQ